MGYGYEVFHSILDDTTSFEDDEQKNEAIIWIKRNLNDARFSELAEEYLYKKGWCPRCGKKLDLKVKSVVHTELEDKPVEKNLIYYCKKCGWKDD